MLAFTINSDLLTIFLGTLAPVVVGAILKVHASNRTKTTVMMLFTLVLTLAKTALDNKGIITQGMLQDWGKMVVVTVATYYGIWKPNDLGNLLPLKGIGGKAGDAGVVDPGEPAPIPEAYK